MKPLYKTARLALLAAILTCHFQPLRAAPLPAAPLAAPAAAEAARDTAGPATPAAPASLALAVRYWSEAVQHANALDHTPPPPGVARAYHEQFGPARSARALAIYHLALFEALNAVLRSYPSYTGMAEAPMDSSPEAALATAARDTLQALYPGQARAAADVYRRHMLRVGPGRARDNGVETGRRAAAAVLAMHAPRSGPGDLVVGVSFFPSNAPGKWRPDPVSRDPLALGAVWDGITPFVLPSVAPFRPPPPPPLASERYTAVFEDVRRLGGDGVRTPTLRTPAQTVSGKWWSYDGTPLIGSAPRLYNQIALHIGVRRHLSGMQMARMLALVNVAMADTCLVVWKTKYAEQVWRPVTGIREASPGTSPTGQGDGNPATHADPTWTPLGAQASNTSLPDFTPPFPSYPSGHASFGSALFQTLRRFYGTDAIAFSFVSDEFNGVTRDNDGTLRPRLVRAFANLSQAEYDNGRSRIYLGVHWDTDRVAGHQAGRRVANYVFEHGLQPATP